MLLRLQMEKNVFQLLQCYLDVNLSILLITVIIILSFLALLSAAIFGNVTTIMMKMYQGTEELKEMRSCVSEFIKFHQMPKCLSKRM